jgi:MFS family permease
VSGPTIEDARLRMSYDESMRVLAQQRDDLERLRARVITLISVASVAAGLLGGFLADEAPARTPWFYAGLVSVGVLVGCVCVILTPWRTIFENDPRVIVYDYVDQGYDLDETLRWWSIYNGDNSDTNKLVLDRLAWVYTVAVVSLGAIVVSFAMALATRR